MGFRPRANLRSSVWFVPVLCVLGGVMLSFGTIAIDRITQAMGQPASTRTKRKSWWRSAAGPSTTAPVAVALGDDPQLAEEEEDR